MQQFFKIFDEFTNKFEVSFDVLYRGLHDFVNVARIFSNFLRNYDNDCCP